MLGLGYNSFKTETALGTSLDGALVFFDDSDTTSMFVERDGSGGNPAPGETVGLMLDKAQMNGLSASGFIASRPELYPGTKLSGPGWTDNGNDTYTKVAGAVAEQQFLVSDGMLIEGEFYSISFTTDQAATVFVYLGGPQITINRFTVTAAGNHSGIVRAESLGSNDALRFNTSTDVTISNISIKHIPGQHKTASADNERPVLHREPVSGRRNLVAHNVTPDAYGAASPHIQPITGRPDPDGGTRAIQLQTDVGAGRILFRLPLIEVPTVDVAITVQIKKNIEPTGSPGFGSDVNDGGSYSYLVNGLNDAAIGEWVTFKYGLAPGAGGSGFFDFALTGGTHQDVDIYLPQIEYGTHTPVQAVTNEHDITETGVRSIYSLDYDGVDDAMSFDFDGGAGPSDCSVFFLVKTTDDQFMLSSLATSGGSWFGPADDGDLSTVLSSNAGLSIGYRIDGQVASPSTRDDLHTLISTGTMQVIEVSSLNLSGWSELRLSDYSGWELEGQLIGPVVIPNITDKQRQEWMKWLRSKY